MLIKWKEFNIDEIKGKYLYKFLAKDKLERFINTGNIWFSRADEFGDKLECVTIKDLKNEKINLELIEQRKKQHLISCFHEATFESLAFWDTYADDFENRRVFALKFERESFCNKIINSNIPINLNLIAKLVHGKVVYKNLLSNRNDKLNNKKVEHVSMRKEYAFSYEREYRFVIKTKELFNKKGIGINLGNPNQLDFQILVNPLLDNEDYIKCIDFLDKKDVYDKFEITKITKFFKPELTA